MSNNRIKQYEKFLVENGIIFEINRTILHPIGLELIVDTAFDNRRKVSIVGLEETDDPDGFMYDEESFEINSDQFARFMEKRQARLQQRKSSLGFTVQNAKPQNQIEIIINGERIGVFEEIISYEAIVQKAGMEIKNTPTVTYKSSTKSGGLTLGNSVDVEFGMRFFVM